MKEVIYQNLVNRLRKINHEYFNLYELWKTDYGSIYYIHLPSKSKNPVKIFLCAGVHGDEPAGVEALIKFLERNNSDLLDNFEFFAIPCLNPYGYSHNVRWNSDGVDINRTFENNLSVEALLVKTFLAEKHFDVFVDFHEDWEYRGFYLFEISKLGRQIGKEIITSIEKIGEIKKEKIIDGFINCNGVINLNCDEFGKNVMALYLAENHASHTLTLETPAQWDFNKRVLAHLESLSIIIDKYLFLKQEIIRN